MHYSNERMARFIGASVKLVSPEAGIDTYSDSGYVTLPNGQVFRFTVEEAPMTRPLPPCPAHRNLPMSYGGNLLVCAHESHAANGTQAQAITCPKCERTSYNPNDVREGYCGNCHDWTSPGNGRN